MRILTGDDMVLFGVVGDSTELGFTDSDVVNALATLEPMAPLTVRINSGGGYASVGVAIHSALMQHPGHVTVQVDGLAASAASLIAMAGDTIVCMPGSLMMIHDPSMLTVGTVDDHGRSIHQLDKTAAAMSSIYSRRTGKPFAVVRAEMAKETWMTAEEAVAAGYADRVGVTVAKTAPQNGSARAQPSLGDLADAEARARASRPEARAAAASWRRVTQAMNARLGLVPTAAKSEPPSDAGRSIAIVAAARAKGAEAYGAVLVASTLSTVQALAALEALPAAIRSEPLAQEPVVTIEAIRAGWAKAVARLNAGRSTA